MHAYINTVYLRLPNGYIQVVKHMCGFTPLWTLLCPSVQGRFLTTGPPGKSPRVGFFFCYILHPNLKTSAFSDYWERIHEDCDESRDEAAHSGLQLEIECGWQGNPKI